MKRFHNFFSRIRRVCKPGQSKAGSSLALVMMIGSALVIWVMCIMPLMTVTGTTAVQTEKKYDTYLEARSAIEFCKSELENIVKEEIPYNFAVIKNGDEFEAIRKKLKGSESLNPAYSNCVDTATDVPKNNADGDKVTAVCTVEWNDSESHYDIEIITYHSGEKEQTYSIIFTPSGSLLIYPESYKQTSALPLSDFVAVDGKLGTNVLWDSNITMSTAVNGNFTETLKSWVMNPEAGYANSGEYPAVFKKTAQAAVSGEGASVGEPITDGEFTDEEWIFPVAVKADKGTKVNGDIWITTSGNNIKVYLHNGAATEITGDCTIYLNGAESTDKKVPAKPGKYCVTIDYKGTAYTTAEGKVNVLPVTGLRMPDIVGTVKTEKQSLNEVSSVQSVTKNSDGTYTVTLTKQEKTDILYGYCTSDAALEGGKYPVTWSSSNEFTGLDSGKTYYFYICRPAAMRDDDGDGVYTYYTDSDPKYAGMVCPLSFATKLESGSEYLVLGTGSDGNYYAMTSDLKAKAFTADYYSPEMDAPAWTATYYTDYYNEGWYLQNSNNNNNYYLAMTLTGNIFKGYSYNLETDSKKGDLFDVEFEGNESIDAKVYKNFGWPFKTAYLSYSDGKFTASTSTPPSTVRFMKIPTATDAPALDKVTLPTESYEKYGIAIDSSLTYGTVVEASVKNNSNVTQLYVNGKRVEKGTELNAGVYDLAADIKVGSEKRSVVLGDLTITKDELSANSLNISVTPKPGSDDMEVKVTCDNWNTDSGVHYFGYQKVGEGTEFHWFYSDKDFYTFRLPFGEYKFAVRECGNSNYNGNIKVSADTISIEPAFIDLSSLSESEMEDFKNAFTYTYDKDTGKVVWYNLPSGILPGRVQLVFGIPGEGDSITWQETYSSEVRFYGVIVNPPFEASKVIQISPPLGISNVGGHTSSMMKGSSLYFMGKENSINTYGNDIYLTTDLLVLSHDITGGGSIYVAPYSTGEHATGDTMLFAVNDIKCGDTTVFKAKTFYKIPDNTDIVNLNAETAAGMKIGEVDGTTKTIPSDVQQLFRQKIYPELNLDITYASEAQLLHIISSETIGWTNGGVLGGNSSSYNEAYAVCAYVTSINGSVNYKANRVLIAAKAADGSYTLNVPANLTFTTRYLSVDADQIVQGTGGVKFVIKNLGQDTGFISSLLNLTAYESRTLQIDYERYTNIVTADHAISGIKQQICRYEDGVDIFPEAENMQPLMVTYTTSDVNGWFDNPFGKTVKMVDRYVSLERDGTNNDIKISALVTNKLNIYANYIYFDIGKIQVDTLGSSSDVIIHSQESGYSDKEYLGLFTEHTGESHGGTLLYFAGQTTLKFGYFSEGKTIAPGFYHIPATAGGTSLSKLADNPDSFKVLPEELKDYSIYINADGSLSNAYVDTGLFDNNSVGFGGFSGGSVK